MKKVLIVSTVSRQFYLFEKNNIQILKQKGFEIHGAANFADRNERLNELGIIEHDLSVQRSPFKITKNYVAYKQLLHIIDEIRPSFIHCHSPVGGLIARLAAKKKNIKVIYTAHGFHFFKGAPILNWLLYYPVEKMLARFTDSIITINSEDYTLANNKFKLKNNGKVFKVPGIGVDLVKINSKEAITHSLKDELGLQKDDILLVSVGELIKNKNHIVILKLLSRLSNNMHFLVCGQGQLQEELEMFAMQSNLANRVHFLGYRSDVIEVLKACDIFIFPSLREGLPVSLMEAMASGLPCVVSNIRGNNELVTDKELLCKCSDIDQYQCSINKLMNDDNYRKKKIEENLEKVKEFSSDVVKKDMEYIYSFFE